MSGKASAPPSISWEEFGKTHLDRRVARAISKLGFVSPTPVQETVIPRAIEGKDVLARARTGTGKTLAYAVPAVERMLAGACKKLSGVILVPSRELCLQV